jgi:hypothetical protein
MFSKRVVMLFYKGTGLEIPTPVEKFDKYMVICESPIIKGLEMGVSLETQKEQILEDLDEMEKYIFSITNGGTMEYDGEYLKSKIGLEKYKKLLSKWSINIISGLKLGVIKNDDMNGYLFMDMNE